MLLGSGVTVEFWETAATYRLKDAQPSGTGWWGQGYIDSLTPRGEDVLLHGEWLSQDDDHHCGLP